MEIALIKQIALDSFSMSDFCVKVYKYCNSKTISKIKILIERENIDVSHFSRGGKNIKHERVIKICPVCNIEFKSTNSGSKNKTTCSSACSNSYFLNGFNNPSFDSQKKIERLKKVSKTLSEKDYGPIKLCKLCQTQISRWKIYCNNKCRYSDPELVSQETRDKLSKIHKELYKSGKTKGWSSRNIESYPEKFFKRVLENNNIEYEFNKPVLKKDLGVNEIGSYFLDFYIPSKNIDLEIDGGQHRYRKDHDDLRDSRISKSYNVYRIKWKNINSESGKEYIRGEIDKFLLFLHRN